MYKHPSNENPYYANGSSRQQPFFPYPGFVPTTPPMPSGAVIPGIPTVPAFPTFPVAPGFPGTPMVMEESLIENVLRLNLGKMATIYMTFENNPEWTAKVFRGRLEAAAKDHIIISDPQTGKRYLLLMVNLDYIEFDEPLRYFRPSVVPEQLVETGR